jgi:uncharacterized glyoxalase superfamily protein PhnB
MAKKISRRTVTPVLAVKGAASAIAFYERALGAEEDARFLGPDGQIVHARIRLGDSLVHIGEADPGGPTASAFELYVPDCDALFRRAVAAGAEITLPMGEQFWGDRMGGVRDPFGQTWMIATRKAQAVARSKRVTFDHARRIAMALPGVAEGPCYGTPGFRVRKKLFARFLADGDTVVLKTDARARVQLLRDQPSVYFLTDHYRAHPWVLLRLQRATERELERRIEDAWRRAAPKALVSAHDEPNAKRGKR